MTELVSIDDLCCRVAPHLSLRVPSLGLLAGQHWCVFGGNGSGKSLLAALLRGDLPGGREHIRYAAGFDPRHDICEVSFEVQHRLCQLDDRHDISDYDPAASDTGTSVFNLITDVPDNARKRVASGRYADLASLMQRLGITELAQQGIRFLSSGQMRRAMLARALYRNPRILLLDNPLESIDSHSADRIISVLRDWMGDDNIILLLSRCAHDIVPGITHMALMHPVEHQSAVGTIRELTLQVSGEIERVQTSAEFALATRLPTDIPDVLPPPCPGREPPELEPQVPMIELAGVSAGYGQHLLFDDLHWQMRVGDHVLIAGPNGCGKSTLLALLDGDNHKAYGQAVSLFGKRRGSGESVWQIKARFGVVSNDLHQRYVKGWRVLDVVVSGFFDSLGLYDDSGASEHNTARAWLQMVGLHQYAASWYHELSLGQQKLVLLARAMVKRPAILVLDEPCVGLDDYHRRLLLAVLERIARDGCTHLLYVNHTAGEMPACINRFIRFDGEGGVQCSPAL